jgi:hypothetical protein
MSIQEEITSQEHNKFHKIWEKLYTYPLSFEDLINFISYLKESITDEILLTKLKLLLKSTHPYKYEITVIHDATFMELSTEQIKTIAIILFDFNAYKSYGEKYDVDMRTIVKYFKHITGYNTDYESSNGSVSKISHDNCIDEDYLNDGNLDSKKEYNDTNVYNMLSEDEHNSQVKVIEKYIKWYITREKKINDKKINQKQKSAMVKVGLTTLTPLVAIGGCLAGAVVGAVGIPMLYVKNIYENPST